MSNNFFNNHPMLGSMFDFNHDGSLSFGEAGAMGAFGAMYADEMQRATEEAEREAYGLSWDDDDPYGTDDDDDEYDPYDSGEEDWNR